MLNERFGKFVVIGDAPNSKDGKRQWRCRCDCGEERDVREYTLVKGTSTSCGCGVRDKASSKKDRDMLGKRFGRLTVKERVPGVSPPTWVCVCECGGEKTVTSRLLTAGKTNSCGCLRRDSIQRNVVIQLAGKVFGKLTVVERAGSDACNRAMWRCRCECGNDHVAAGFMINSGKVKSCGCLRSENAARLFTKHGKYGTPAYVAWTGMIQRCTNPYNASFHNYGQRGIRVCERWRDSFEAFLEDMGECPPGLTINRKDNDGDYCKENCEWATDRAQANNKSNTVLLTHLGKTQSAAAWSAEVGLPHTTILRRKQSGWSDDDVLTTPMHATRKSRGVSEQARLRNKANHAVQSAVKKGELARPDRCEHPGCQEKEVRSFHHLGFEDEHHLDVVWLCSKHFYWEMQEKIEHGGEVRTLKEWAEHLGITPTALRSRLDNPDWTVEEAMTIKK